MKILHARTLDGMQRAKKYFIVNKKELNRKSRERYAENKRKREKE